MPDALIKPYMARDKPIHIGNDASKLMENVPLRENLQLLLKKQRRTAREVSLAAGLSASAVRHILRGHSLNPNPNTLRQIASALGVSVDALTGESPRPLTVAPLQRFSSELVEDQAELRLLRHWRALSDGERAYFLDLIRNSILG